MVFSVILLIFGVVLADGVVQEKYTAPSPAAIAALKNVSDLNVLPFYRALRDLYLTGGFSVSNQLNAIILGQSNISLGTFVRIIEGLNATRWEIENGDVSMRRMDSMLNFSSPDALIHQPWIYGLSSEILKSVENPKNFTHSIGKLGNDLIGKGLTRLNYNYTELENFLESWLKAFPGAGSLSTYMTVIHHTIGPENFAVLQDILTSIPWQTDGLYPEDARLLQSHSEHLISEITSADSTTRLLKRLRAALRNMTDSDDTLHFISELAQKDLVPEETVKVLKGKATANISSLITKTSKEVGEKTFKKFVEAAEKAVHKGIGGFEQIERCLIAGARMVYNLNHSTEHAVSSVEKVHKAYSKEPQWVNRLASAEDIVRRMPQAAHLIFDAFFNLTSPPKHRLFEQSRAADLSSMLSLFASMRNSDPKLLMQVMTYLDNTKWNLFMIKTQLSTVKTLNNMPVSMKFQFGAQDLAIDDVTGAYNLFWTVENITELAVKDSDLFSYYKDVKTIIESTKDSAKFQWFMNQIVEFSQLTRDGKWMDVYYSLGDISDVIGAGSTGYEPFEKLNDIMGVNGSYSEVFLAMEMIVSDATSKQIDARVQFIKEFFDKIENVEGILIKLGVDASKIRAWNEATHSVDPLVQVLSASRTYSGLRRLLTFHSEYTTNSTDASMSVNMMDDMIVYLQQQST